MTGTAAGSLIALLVAMPIAGAIVAFLLPPRFRAIAGILTASATTLLVALVITGVMQAKGLHHDAGGWSPPLGIHLRVDGLSGIFLALTAVVGLMVSIYARAFYSAGGAVPAGGALFWPLWLFLWGGMNGVFVSGDLFNLYVLIEVTGISAVGLTVQSGYRPALVAGLRYLLATLLGSMAFLMGVALIYGMTGMLDLQLIGETSPHGGTARVALALIVVGLMVKTALFPLHFWLPSAHSAAQPPVSAILSALVVKLTFYLILRLWVDVFSGSLTFAAGQAVGVLGSAAIIWGSYQALRQDRLKLLIAHSTVGQIGYLFLIFPLITVTHEAAAEAEWLPHAWKGGVYQALAHALAKASMFLAIGVSVMAVGHDRRESLVDLVTRLPMTTFALALAGISLIGLPPSGGFVAKWMLLKAAFSSGQWWWAPVVVWGSLLTAGYVFGILKQTFAPAEQPIELKPVPRVMQVTALLLGIAAIAIGFRSAEVIMLLDVDTPFAEATGIEEQEEP